MNYATMIHYVSLALHDEGTWQGMNMWERNACKNYETIQPLKLSRLAMLEHQLCCCVGKSWTTYSLASWPWTSTKNGTLHLYHLSSKPSGINLTLDNAKGSEGWKLIALRAFRPLRCLPSWSWPARHLEHAETWIDLSSHVLKHLKPCGLVGCDVSLALLLSYSIASFERPMPSAMGDGLWPSAKLSEKCHFDRRPLFLASFIWSKMSFLIPGSSPRPPSVVWAAQMATKRRLRRYHMPGSAPRKLSACPQLGIKTWSCTALTVAWTERSRAENATLLTVLTKKFQSCLPLLFFFVFFCVPFPAGGPCPPHIKIYLNSRLRKIP